MHGAPSATATVPTPHASRYLQQLCKHWSHRFETEFDAARGKVNFGAGAAHFAAAPAALTLTLHASDASGLARLEGAVADHLKRFAFREDPGRRVAARLNRLAARRARR